MIGSDLLKVGIEESIGWLEYDRPPVNAFSRDMLLHVQQALDALIADKGCRVIVIASTLEKHFSAGADLQVFDGISRDGMADLAAISHGIVRTVRSSPKPVLAAIHGAAVGGGLEITFHCDRRFAAADARIGSPEIHLNFVPPIAGTQGLVRLLGRSNALDYLYRGDLIGVEEAKAMGLVDVVCPPNSLREDVAAYAAMLAEKPPEALAAIRRCVIDGGARAFEEGLAIELDCVISLTETANFQEGVRAFLERRAPNWS